MHVPGIFLSLLHPRIVQISIAIRLIYTPALPLDCLRKHVELGFPIVSVLRHISRLFSPTAAFTVVFRIISIS